jgi:hypothetical protein
MLTRSFRLFPVAVWLAAATLPLTAQNIRGTILGTVRDASGSVIPGAVVKVTQPTTGLTRSEITNASGEYLIPQLPVGAWVLDVEHAGFKHSQRTGIVLEVDQKLRQDVTLEVGQVTDSVAVEAGAPVISTDSATVGNVVENKKVTELPLNGRNFLQLNLLVPGVNQGVKGSQNQTQGGSISVNGSREQSNNFLLDGADNNDLAINQYAVAISTEAIQEFKVQASTYSAEFGRSSGGQINVATKAGTNSYHGVLYEYLRNDVLDAKNFFDRPGPIPGYKRNQYGGSIGGPIRKDKTFFFGNYEGARIRQGITKVATEPTAAMKSGDFSGLLGGQISTDAAGRPVYANEIFDPTTLHAATNGAMIRDPFPGNIIPPSRISQVGANVVNLYPNPNTPGGLTFGQYTSSPTKTDDFDQFTIRVDHRFNDRNNLFGRYSYIQENRFDTFDSFCAGSNNVPGFGCNTLNGGQNAVLNYVHLFGATKVNEARFAFTRVRGGIIQQNSGNDQSTKLGIIGTSRNPLDFGYPVFTVTGYSGLGEATNLPQDRHDNTFQYADSMSWTTGRHAVKFGGDFRRFQENFLFDSTARGTLTFNPFYTAATTASGSSISSLNGTGNAVADLLLGFPYTSSISRSFAGPTASTVAGFRTYSLNFFVQDDFRVLPNLTLNVGLRWEYNSPVIDKYNHMGTYDLSQPNSLRFSTPQKRNLYDTSFKEFAPRFGFAWTPIGPKTVIRGGYGIYWDVKLLNIVLSPAISAPFLTGYTFNQSTNGRPNIDIANPYGGNGTPAVPAATWLESPFRDGYVQQWSFNVQHELTSSMGVTAAFVGSKGTHLDRAYDGNAPAPEPVFIQANRPNPAFAAITVRSASANSNYNSFQLTFEKRFTKGLSFLSAYTYSKSIDDASAWSGSVIVVNNFHAERGLSTFDTRNRWISSYTYDLPFGRGRQFGSSMPGWANLLVGGWQNNAIFTMQSGNPLDTSVGLQLSGTNTGTRPDVNGNPNNFPHDPAKWFNTSVFTYNFTGRFGNAGRDIVIGPGTTSFDFALLKNFGLGKEYRYLQFRTEFFNIANHPNFDNPSTTVTSPTFGRITSAGVQDSRASSRQIQFAMRLVF